MAGMLLILILNVVLVVVQPALNHDAKYRSFQAECMNPVVLIRAIDSQAKRKMGAVGLGAVLLTASLVLTLGFLGGFWNPADPADPVEYPLAPIFTITETVENDFADFIPYDEEFILSSPQYSISPSLTNIANLGLFPTLTTEDRQFIESNGFVAAPQSEFKQIHEILLHNYYHDLPSFVSSDAVLHAFHVLYDLALREAEVYSFWTLLGNLTESLVDSSYAQYLDAPGGKWQDAALRNVMFFSVALCLLDNQTTVYVEVQDAVAQVLALIEAHEGYSDQWFMGYHGDFSQYVPRGHYTRTDLLGRYFKAMMWFGRVSFRLIPDGDIMPNNRGLNETAQAILLSLALEDEVSGLLGGAVGYEIWDAIYQPTVFFVGSADDLLPSEYLSLVHEIYGEDVELQELDNDGLLHEFIQEALTFRAPLILSSRLFDTEGFNQTNGFRFMGQRFIPDSYILGQLVYTYVGTSSVPRLMPKGLDVMAALGSERAWDLLDDQKHYVNYVEQMEMLWNVTDNISAQEWTKNLYYLWLYSLLPLLTDPGQGYPAFMQSEAWVDKQLMTALGSWTELRHDTMLYAKQSYTVEGISISPLIGYVEPMPRLYARLASLCAMMKLGLEIRSLSSLTTIHRLDALHDFLRSLQEISIKELSGQSLNETEIHIIKNCGDTLEYITSRPADDPLLTDTDEKMAVIADVHTDGNSETVLQEAVGNPMIIYVAVYIEGQVVLTRGGTFSYYEFIQPMNDRLTDEAWQNILDAGEEPPLPSWLGSFVVNTGSEGAFLLASVVERPDE
jgi:hypothetical protein